jgi:hypothetical protein
MRKTLWSVLLMLCCATVTYAQSFTDTFDSNSLGWNECPYESEEGMSVINKGVLKLKSKEEAAFFETHCYAPLDIQKPFEIIANVKIDELDDDKLCGLVFNYRDNGNFYCFAFNDQIIKFIRFVDNENVGSVRRSVKWTKTKRIEQEWKLVSDGDTLSFFVNGMEILKVKYMPLTYSGVGFYVMGDDQVVLVKDITFTQM